MGIYIKMKKIPENVISISILHPLYKKKQKNTNLPNTQNELTTSTSIKWST